MINDKPNHKKNVIQTSPLVLHGTRETPIPYMYVREKAFPDPKATSFLHTYSTFMRYNSHTPYIPFSLWI
jgi:hypothetical protein